MCPWVGPHAPSFGWQLWGLPSRVEYLSPQGVLLPLVYGTTASPLWLELRGRSAGQATPSWTVYRLACHRLLPWLRVMFAMVPDAAWPHSDQWPWSTAPATGPVGRLGRPSVSDPWGVGSFLSLGRRTCVRCPGPLGSCSPVCPLGALRCVCGVQGHLAPVHRCARSVRCFACAVSWATWLLFTGVLAWFVVLRVRCPGSLGSCSPVRPLGVLCCVWGVLGHLAPVHRCVRLVCCFVCAPSWAIWLLFTGVHGRGVPSLCCPWCLCVRGVLAQVAPVHRRARCVRCACAVGGCVSLPPPLIFIFSFLGAFSSLFFFPEKIDKTFFFKFFTKKGARIHCRHKHGQLVQWCNSVVFSGVCRRCFGGPAPGVRLARPDVHGYGSGWVWLGASLL